MSLFYTVKSSVLETFEKLEADMGLSVVLKQFVKAETGKVDLQTDYLKGLLTFMELYKPLYIFSELEEISRLLSHEKVAELAKRIDEVNPKGETTTTTDIFEV